MGLKHWFQGLLMIIFFMVAVGLPCYIIGLWGSKMINDLGNKPSQSAKIQAKAGPWILLIEAFSFSLLVGLFIFLYNIQNE